MPKLEQQDMPPRCASHNRAHEGPFCPECCPELFAPSASEVFVGGIKLLGRTATPDEAAEFLDDRGIAPTVRLDKAYCSPSAPSTVATDADRRRGYRVEAVVGLPDEYRGETVWARGALRFEPGWDKQVRTSKVEDLYVDSEGNIREATPDFEGYDRLDEGVVWEGK